LLILDAETHKAVALREAQAVQDHLGGLDGGELAGEDLVQLVVIHIRAEVAHPDAEFALVARQFVRVAGRVQAETHDGIGAGNGLSVQLVHRVQRMVIRYEVDEAVAGRFAGVLVAHQAHGGGILAHLPESGDYEVFGHVGFQLKWPFGN